jgi:hypothetical protein
MTMVVHVLGGEGFVQFAILHKNDQRTSLIAKLCCGADFVPRPINGKITLKLELKLNREM